MSEVDVHQWRCIGAGAQLSNGQKVTLRNDVADLSVRYGEREYGINLVWDEAANLANVSLHRATPGGGRIAFGDHVAVRVDGGGYLRYEEREYGINLVWSPSPVLQWEVTGGVFGQPVPLARPVGLFNRLHGDHVLYGSRRFGINLRWWSDLDVYGTYPPLPMPPELRGQSGEPGQVVLSGTASRIELFHGGTDDELDWHVYIRLDPAVRRRLLSHLLTHTDSAHMAHGPALGPWSPVTEQDLERVYCELMVLDGYDNLTFDEKFYSADLTRALMIDRTAWDVSAEAAEEQGLSGATVAVTGNSALSTRNARVALQGAFVNDRAHRFRVEIHPLDSLAYAINAEGRPLSSGPDDPNTWPGDLVTWRVAVFTNSTFHRINRADYLKKTRTTTWYLPLPGNAGRPGTRVTIAPRVPGFTNQARGRGGLDELRPTQDVYNDYRLANESHAIERDYRTGEQRLRVTVAMQQPDRWGGMFLTDYTLRVRPQVVN